MRILVVEDEEKVASFIRKGLEEERYAVDVALDGEEGLELAELNPYDLIVLDLMLPGLDGFRFIQRLRAQGVHTPILVLTARDSVGDKVKGLDLGADDYLTKPFAFAELLARIRALLRRGAPQAPPVLQVADLTLDPAARRVTRAGKPIELTAKEFALLEYFMRHAGRVLTRTMILEHVWDQSFDSYTNVVDVYVNYLRKKVDQGFEPRLIHTVRGVGYVLREEP
ncbi:heavy metal response regulator transcription factor [Deferrisoma camini]|uniref:heavy metal response regulator transcription factor n=1 Tax=Deferrisoma camini TaxID=1035120 RepID=UPI00046D6216|nr:response regulator transcription factor [Deferrisoma camini]NOY44412.1 response regulator transcription factor [Deltaproteobacteria bacterium]